MPAARVPPSLPPPSEDYLAARRRANGLDKVTSIAPPAAVVSAPAAEEDPQEQVFASLEHFRHESFEEIAPEADKPAIAGLIRQMSCKAADENNTREIQAQMMAVREARLAADQAYASVMPEPSAEAAAPPP